MISDAGVAPEPGQRTEAESALAREFAGRRASEDGRRRHGYVFGAFDRWCRANGRASLPAAPDDVLRYLHMHYDRWGWGCMWAVVTAIGFAHVESGMPDPTREGRVRPYLTAVRRAKGRYVEPRQVDAIRTQDVAQMVKYFSVCTAEAARTRVVIALAYATGVTDTAKLTDTKGIHLDEVPDGVQVTVAGRRGVLDDLIPGALATVSDVDDLASLFDGYDPATAADDLRAAWTRANLPGDCDRRLPRLGPGDLQWLIAHAEPNYEQVVRDVAYILVGHALGRRHAELADLKLSHLQRRIGGWQVTIAKSKTDPTGRGHTLPLDHDDLDGDDCDAICGACALEALLAVHERRYGRSLTDAARLLPANLATGKHWSHKQASRTLRTWWRAAGLDAEARISTRGIRAGTATSLSERGVPLVEISEVTLHRNLTVLLRYIRRYDPVRWHYHLPV